MLAAVLTAGAALVSPLVPGHAEPVQADSVTSAGATPRTVRPWTPAPPGTYPVRSAAVGYAAGGDPQQALTAYVPVGARSGRAVTVLVHGGGYFQGSRDTFAAKARDLAGRGYVAVAIDYRLSTRPDGAWPAQRSDLSQALLWVRRHAMTSWQADPERIGVIGMSAGGHLALYAQGMPGVRSVAVWSPMLDPYDVAYLTRPGTELSRNLIALTARCSAEACPTKWHQDLHPPGYGNTRRTVPIYAATSTDELIDERPLLAYHREVLARGGRFTLDVVPGTAHAVGPEYEGVAWPATLTHLRRTL